MENKLKKLMQELEDAIHESVHESGHVGAVIGQIEEAGYDVLLVLESTMRLSAKDRAGDRLSPEDDFNAYPPALSSTGTIELTRQDEEFLHALQIAI